MRTRRFVFAFVLGSVGSAFAQDKKPAMPSSHICYFSMNNGKEFPELEKFLTQLNKASPNLKITVAEYQTEGSNPEESFRAMLRDLKAEGRHCDGLVLSGHHTGSFSGMRASGTLGVEFLESLSCEPANREFFSKIQSVWLQGCRTMGVCKVAFGTDAERQQFAGQIQAGAQAAAASSTPGAPAATPPVHSADFHTERVGAVLAEDHLTQSYAQLNTEFSATLDQDNPLSTRYLRIFPRAAVFGWTATAPGPVAKSEYSLPYHIAHTTKHMDDRKELFQNPQQVLSENSARAYGSTLKGMLHRDHAQLSKGCVGDACQKGWMDQASSKTMGYDTTEANALPPLVSGSSQALLRAKALECEIKSPSSPEAHAKALRDILEDPTQVAYNFNSLWELLQKTEAEGDEKKLKELRAQYAKSIPLANFLNHKFKDPSLGTLRKIDYYAFYRDMMGQKNDVIEGRILEAAKAVLMKEAKGYDQRDYQQTMIQSLAKNGLLNDSFVEEIMGGPEAHPDNKLELLGSVPSDHYTPSAKMLQSIVADSRATGDTFTNLLRMMSQKYTDAPGMHEPLKQIVSDKRASAWNLHEVADVIAQSKIPQVESAQLLTQILKDPRSNYVTLGRVAGVVRTTKQPRTSEFLKQILADKRTNRETLQAVARSIEGPEYPGAESAEILKNIIDDKRANDSVLGAAAYSVAKVSPLPEAHTLLRKILADSRSGYFALSNVAQAVGDSDEPVAGASDILSSVLSHRESSQGSVGSVASAIGALKYPVANPDELLEKAIKDKDADAYTLKVAASSVGRAKLPFANSHALLTKIKNDPRSDDSVLSGVVEALEMTSQDIPGADALLKSVLSDSRASNATQASYIKALVSGRFKSIKVEEEFDRFVRNPEAHEGELSAVAQYIADAKVQIRNPRDLFERIARHPRQSYDSLRDLIETLEMSQLSVEERERLIREIRQYPDFVNRELLDEVMRSQPEA